MRAPMWCRELFAGRAGLSTALRDIGLSVRAPMEAFPSRHIYIRECDLDRPDVFVNLLTEIIGGWYRFLHIGLPCSTWSALARLNGSSRSPANPDGVRPWTRREAISWDQAERMVTICLLMARKGGLFYH